MFREKDKVLVAVSGGPDSVALLCILNEIKQIFKIKIFVAHLNHAVRGKESDEDADFVRELSHRLGVKMVHGRLPSMKRHPKLSLEEWLRGERYKFLKQAAVRLKVKIIATAHTLDDQAETVLMRIIKGSSAKGLIGIHPVRYEGTVKYVRPLLEIEKTDILGYLADRNILFRRDSSNLKLDFLRNNIRRRVLPYLSRINPRIKYALFNLSSSLKEDFDFIEEEKRIRKKMIRTGKTMRYIPLGGLIAQPKALQREIIREALKSTGGNIKKLTYEHWRNIHLFLKSRPNGKSMDLPGNIKLRKSKKNLVFEK